MQAGEIGVILQIYPNANMTNSPVNLTGATCTLCVLSPLDTETNLALLVSPDGSYAYRSTLASDFPVGGQYEIQLVAAMLNGSTLKSPFQFFVVGDALC